MPYLADIDFEPSRIYPLKTYFSNYEHRETILFHFIYLDEYKMAYSFH